jgi:hypothetical protein
MNQTELAADGLNRSFGMLTQTIADFSDADILVRPVPAANHTAWQLGHLAVATAHLCNMIKPGSVTPPAPAFAEKFTKETSSKDDAAFFPKKAAIMDQLSNVTSSAVAMIKTLTPADLDKPMPEKMAAMFPTAGHVVGMLSGHLMMHVGQFQVIRRKLGRPILF